MYKIYSRKRFILKPSFIKSGGGYSKNKFPNGAFINKRKILKILLIFILAIIIYKLILDYIEPVFETLCEEKVKSMYQ